MPLVAVVNASSMWNYKCESAYESILETGYYIKHLLERKLCTSPGENKVEGFRMMALTHYGLLLSDPETKMDTFVLMSS